MLNEQMRNQMMLIVAGLMIYDKIQEKNPELCGFKADDFDKEENK